MVKHCRLCAIWPVVICLLAIGCSDGDAEPSASPDKPINDQPEPQPGEILVESIGPTVLYYGQMQDARSVIQMILEANPILPADQYTLRIDETLTVKHQLRFWVEPTAPQDRATIDQAADQAYKDLKEVYEAVLEKELNAHLEAREGQLAEAGEKLTALQQSFGIFQEAHRGVPQTNDSRLERRKFDLAIKNALNEQIELDKQITALKRQIERNPIPTLLRIR